MTSGEALDDVVEPTPLLDLAIFCVALAGFTLFYGLARVVALGSTLATVLLSSSVALAAGVLALALLVDAGPGHALASAYDIVCNGNEIGGGSIRIHSDGAETGLRGDGHLRGRG